MQELSKTVKEIWQELRVDWADHRAILREDAHLRGLEIEHAKNIQPRMEHAHKIAVEKHERQMEKLNSQL